MDQDTTRAKGKHVSILADFENRQADILLGTQMVAKGLNFPAVKLVGVLQADIGLHFPDFRASERTFQLLAQVAGRAGRKDNVGEVVIQTYLPEEPGILATVKHDYPGFFEREIEERKALGYPPFSKLARIVVQGPDESRVGKYAEKIASLSKVKGQKFLSVLGPSPAALSRIKGSHRYSVLLKSRGVKALAGVLNEVRRECKNLDKSVKVIVDVDAVNML
jgi:primosomal protein N' (replication factor Y)